ncbi:MAG: SRPBCC family protein [Dongiaceae bacterium]
MLKKILIILAAITAVFLIAAALQPDEFRVARAIAIQAPPEAVFAHVNDLRKWEAWSPWAKLDPNAKNSFEGAPSGKGAIMRWAGNHEVGEGSMTIVESRRPNFIQLRLDFLKPFAATSMAEFTLVPQGDETLVTWSMYGENNYTAKMIGLVMNCEKMISEQFDKGLASLKQVVETQ